MTIPSAPKGLTTRSRKLWRAVLDEFELAPSELELLRSALVALDRADAAAAVIDAEGITVLDRYGTPKQHPACDVEARSRTLFARFVAQLGVKVDQNSGWQGRAKPGPRPRGGRPLRAVAD